MRRGKGEEKEEEEGEEEGGRVRREKLILVCARGNHHSIWSNPCNFDALQP